MNINRMITKRKIFFYIISFAVIVFPFVVFAQYNTNLPSGSGLPDKTISQIITQIISWLLGFVAIIAILALIWGGVRYLTAAGDDSQVEEAKNIITQAVIGLVIAGISYAIVKVVVEKWIGT